MTIGNSIILVIAALIIVAETLLLAVYILNHKKKEKQQKFILQKIVFSLTVVRKLRSIISQKSRQSVLQVAKALGDLELIEEEIQDKIFANLIKDNKNTVETVQAIDNTLCECLESLQFEDYTAQIREHIQVLLDDASADIYEMNISPQIQKEVTDKCRQIFSIDEEFAVLDHISEDMRK